MATARSGSPKSLGPSGGFGEQCGATAQSVLVMKSCWGLRFVLTELGRKRRDLPVRLSWFCSCEGAMLTFVSQSKTVTDGRGTRAHRRISASDRSTQGKAFRFEPRTLR